MKKYKYKVLIWFRYGNFEKDSEEVEIEAENDEQALQLAKKHRRWVFKTEIVSRDEASN